jgi:glycerol-3-phosphate dehydrogenase
VVNATGPVSDSLRELASAGSEKRMRPSKGAHILLPLEVFPPADALVPVVGPLIGGGLAGWCLRWLGI